MKSVQVSVIVPSYNAELYIGRCIRSLLKQSLSQEDFEIIVINDSSKDNTKNALLPFVGDIVLIENKRKAETTKKKEASQAKTATATP